MANKPSKIISEAKRMIAEKYVYVYGYKGTKVTKSGVESLAKQYPNVFTSSIKSMALKKVGKMGIDCSGFVCKAANIPMQGSTQIKEGFVSKKKVNVKNTNSIKNGMGIWRDGHIALLEVDSKGEVWVLEAKGTAYDLVRTKYSERGSHFTYYGKIKGVDYSGTKTVKEIKEQLAKTTSSTSVKTTITTKCKLYKGASIVKDSYGSLAVGKEVEFVKDTNKGWSKVKATIGNSSYAGYVKNTCLKKTGLSKYRKATITADPALMRKSNNKKAEVIVKVPKGTTVTVVSVGKFWVNVKYKKGEKTYDGFIFYKRLSIK